MTTWYVDGSVGSSGHGTSLDAAFKTISEAVNAASGSDTIRVSGGVYKETVTIGGSKSGSSSSNRTRLLGDSEDPFVLSGGVTLPNLIPCVSGDAAQVGDNWGSIYKTTVPTSSFPNSDPNVANLCEEGVQLPFCVERAVTTDTFFLTRPAYYHTAESTTLSGANVTGYRHPAVTDNYTKAQLENSILNFVTDPNKLATSTIVFNTSTKVMALNSPKPAQSGDLGKQYALYNLLPSMKQGEWGYIESGSNTTVYVWPRNSANVAAGNIEYSSLAKGLNLTGLNRFEAAHFVVRQYGCTLRLDNPISVENSTSNRDDIYLHHFEVNDVIAVNGYAAIYVNGVNNLHMHDFKVTRAQGMFGMFLQGNGAGNADWPRLGFNNSSSSVAPNSIVRGASSGASVRIRIKRGSSFGWFYFDPKINPISGSFISGENLTVNGNVVGTYDPSRSQLSNKGDASLVNQSLNANIHDFDFNYISSAAIRVFTNKNAAFYHGIIRNSSKQTHGNSLNFYQGCHNCLVWGVNCQTADGFVTWQESDSLVFAFLAASASTAANGGARAIYNQQNNDSEHPGAHHGYLGSAVLNCRATPMPERVSNTAFGNSLDVSSSLAPDDLWTVRGNIHHGSSSESGAALLVWDNNINTKDTGTGSLNRGLNDITIGVYDLYVDPESGNWDYPTTGPGSSIRNLKAYNWSTLISSFAARWPQVPVERFQFDMANQLINWSDLRYGPVGDMEHDYGEAGGEIEPPPPPPDTEELRVTSSVIEVSLTVS